MDLAPAYDPMNLHRKTMEGTGLHSVVQCNAFWVYNQYTYNMQWFTIRPKLVSLTPLVRAGTTRLCDHRLNSLKQECPAVVAEESQDIWLRVNGEARVPRKGQFLESILLLIWVALIIFEPYHWPQFERAKMTTWRSSLTISSPSFSFFTTTFPSGTQLSGLTMGSSKFTRRVGSAFGFV